MKNAIHSEAFRVTALKSERNRIYCMLLILSGFLLIVIFRAFFNAQDQTSLKRFALYFSFWLICGLYELLLLWITIRAQRHRRNVNPWVWTLNTFIECSVPTLAILGQTADKTLLGPYLPLTSGSLIVYCFFIILATLRLSPVLCIFAGVICSFEYAGAVLFTLWVAPNNRNAHIYPYVTYVMNTMFLLAAGVIAAAVAWQIRRHVIAALAEAETRRTLDRIEQDLQTARTIQMGLLPKSAPHLPGYDIAGWSQPADQTGGDYYDWLELPPLIPGETSAAPRVLFTIADATGHGIGPALLVAACRAYFRAIASHNDPVESITRQVDALLSADVPDGRFITAAVALLDPVAHHLSLYSAGHAPLYHYHAATNTIETFDSDQPPLGIRFATDPVAGRHIPLAPGDALILITDGFFECANPNGDLFGIEPLAHSILQNIALPAKDLIQKLHQQVIAHIAGTPQADDLTAVIIRRNP